MTNSTDSPFLASANTNTTHQGSIWAVLLQPSFPDLVFEASALLTKSTLPPTSNPNISPILSSSKISFLPTDFSIQIKQNALDLIQKYQPIRQNGNEDDQEDEDDEDQNEDLKEINDTKEIKDQKIKIVEEIWSHLQTGCFNKTDDRELEATINLLITLLLSLFSTDHLKFSSMVKQLLEAISKAEGKTTSYGRYNVLFTLFNALPAPIEHQIPLQLNVLQKLSEMSQTNLEDVHLLLPTLMKVPSYLTSWDLMKSNEGIRLIQNIISLLTSSSKKMDAYNLSIVYLSSSELKSLDPTDQTKLEPIIEQTIQLTLTLNDCYRWDLLDEIKPISNYIRSNPIGKARYETLLQLLKSNETKNHEAIEDLLNSDSTQLSTQIKESIKFKSKLLTLTDLCSKRVGGKVSYEEIQSALGLKSEGDEEEGMEVEEWIINAVKAKLISARVDQPNRLVYINQSSSRSFGNQDWKGLGTKLGQWTDSIDQLIEVVDQSLNEVKLVTVSA
ncbi:uncharacterized protein MELLADRAFT_116134 [Melampsora larici-populina 98AG31]|uniref:Eukaryotic translation initiation factor 3 subunit M n=1 Tax=Melampsora larici-populina (strain 98AG31 / pathotype 3-4-7) TaxID=747676 RepID=F4RI09_MELLP|nr:uncharacterized protein MELLADRAFT_116134 [Melampsora larici-populina 98AG31]EGG08036.1 hypothetical protein MELLADRAFT_116134 [Melampsora larici-populina 98AG31]